MTALGITPWIDTDEVETPSVPASPDIFARKVIYVICNASVTPDVGRHAYERCMRALASGSTARTGFRHARKADAIDEVWRRRDELFDGYQTSANPVLYLETLPWIGPVMRHSLAYLLGLSDRQPAEAMAATPSSPTDPEDLSGSAPRLKASEVGFCIVDSNADFIADHLIRRIHDAAIDLESEVNRLYRGRHSYDLNGVARIDLEKAIERLTYMARTLHEVDEAQAKVVYLQAAE